MPRSVKQKQQVVMLRVDASRTIGWGHLMRCLSLAEQLNDFGFKIIFACKKAESKIRSKLQELGVPVIWFPADLPLNDDAWKTVRAAKRLAADWIVLDGYRYDCRYQSVLKRQGFKVMSIDDMTAQQFKSDIVLNQNLNAERYARYHVPPDTKVFLGVRYALLRSQIRKAKRGFHRRLGNKCDKILVIIGGGKYESVLRKIISALKNYDRHQLKIRIVCARISKELRAELTQNGYMRNHQLNLFVAPPSVADHIKWCDFAITAAGSTVWELAGFQTPMLVGVLADNQIRIARELQLFRAAKSVGWFKTLKISKLTADISRIIESRRDRKEMSNMAGRLGRIAGKDVCHIINYMKNAKGSKGYE